MMSVLLFGDENRQTDIKKQRDILQKAKQNCQKIWESYQ